MKVLVNVNAGVYIQPANYMGQGADEVAEDVKRRITSVLESIGNDAAVRVTLELV